MTDDCFVMQVLSSGEEIKLQRNALVVLEYPTGHEPVSGVCPALRSPPAGALSWRAADLLPGVPACRTFRTRRTRRSRGSSSMSLPTSRQGRWRSSSYLVRGQLRGR